jgi:simple sugar transport system permease protein
VAADIILVIQAVILAFVAAPAIIRTVFRIRTPEKEVAGQTLSAGWGKT